MYKNKKIILFAFATSDLKRSIKRLNDQAINSNYYSDIRIMTPSNFSNNEKIKMDHLQLRDMKHCIKMDLVKLKISQII